MTDAQREAASEMLKALKKITQRLDDQKVHGIDPSQDIEDFANAAIARARAAGIKTEGE